MRKLMRHIKHRVTKAKAKLPKNAKKMSPDEAAVLNELQGMPPGLAEAIMRGSLADAGAPDPIADGGPGEDDPTLAGAYAAVGDGAGDDLPDDDSGIV